MPNFYWQLRKVGAKDSKDITFHTVYDPLIWTNPKGRLVVIALDEGEYELFDWEILFGFKPTSFFKIPFSIKSGHVTYKGRINLKLNRESLNYSVDSSDHMPEDFEYLKTNIANVSDATIDNQLAIFLPCNEAACIRPKQEPARYTIIIPIVVH